MSNNTKLMLAAALFAALATPALAQDEWIVDSGRYVNGQAPSYTEQQFHSSPRVFEGRNSAVIEESSGRDALVQLN